MRYQTTFISLATGQLPVWGLCARSGGAAGEGVVSEHGVAAETGMGARVRAWNEERLDKERWVYMWADGVYSGLRAEHTKLCALVVIGVNERGEKRFLATVYGNPRRAGASCC